MGLRSFETEPTKKILKYLLDNDKATYRAFKFHINLPLSTLSHYLTGFKRYELIRIEGGVYDTVNHYYVITSKGKLLYDKIKDLHKFKIRKGVEIQ